MPVRPTYLLIAMSALHAATADAQATKKMPKAAEDQRVSGVLSKVEDAGKGKGKGRKLTIQTDAVWADWVRDQATKEAGGTLAKAAEKGKQGIAAKGEPAADDDRTVVEVTADAKLEVRYRSSTDETNAGSATPGEAAAQGEEGKPAAKPQKKAEAPKAIKPEELKVGLFVEVEYAKVGGQNRVKRLIVLRPVGGAQTSAAAEGTK